MSGRCNDVLKAGLVRIGEAVLQLLRIQEEALVNDARHISFAWSIVDEKTWVMADAFNAQHERRKVKSKNLNGFQCRAGELAFAFNAQCKSPFTERSGGFDLA